MNLQQQIILTSVVVWMLIIVSVCTFVLAVALAPVYMAFFGKALLIEGALIWFFNHIGSKMLKAKRDGGL